MPESILTRRKLWQTYQRLNKARNDLFDYRKETNKEKNLDLAQFADQALLRISESIANLRVLCKRKFGCDLDDLEVYK